MPKAEGKAAAPSRTKKPEASSFERVKQAVTDTFKGLTTVKKEGDGAATRTPRIKGELFTRANQKRALKKLESND